MRNNNIEKVIEANRYNSLWRDLFLICLLNQGHDTTTATIEFLLYNLARFPDVQQKVFEEARRVFGDHQKERITTKKLNELKYLDLVLKETLRLFPAVPFIGRHASEDVVLSKLILRNIFRH